MTILKPARLRCEHLETPFGLNDGQPRFTWAVEALGQDRRQTAYRIVVGESVDAVSQGEGALWDSGKVASDNSNLIPYEGRPLLADRRVHWSVQVWDENDDASELSGPATIWTGLRPGDWVAQWVARPWVPKEGLEPPSASIYNNPWRARPVDYIRKSFAVGPAVRRATLYSTALGVYQVYLNGQRIGDHELAPGWTDYHTRVEYQLYDVTEHLACGDNAIGIALGEGWYAGRVGMAPQRAGAHYGGRPVFMGQLHLEYEDGSKAIIATDETWRTSNGPIIYSDLMIGERYDARLELEGWHQASFDDSKWPEVEKWDEIPRIPVVEASRLPPIRRTLGLTPSLVGRSDSGELIFDLGQNISGFVTLETAASEGQQYTLRHAEVLTPAGDLYVENLRDAIQTDIYIGNGRGRQSFTPSFTYHGFRYVGVSTSEGDVDPTAITLVAHAVHSDTPTAGHFECGEPMVNQLISNILWSQRGNFISVPTDCPQRDERLGWIADAQIFLRTATFNMDVAAFFSKWMIDIADTETEDGFADIAPSKPGFAAIPVPPRGAPAWGDGAIIIPWRIYQYYGDKEILERHYDSLVRWMNIIERHNPDFLRKNFINRSYGDWLNVGAATPRTVVNTAYWAHIADLMRKISGVLGRRKDEARFKSLFRSICEAYRAAFVREDGLIEGDTQTAYLVTLDFGLVTGELAERVAHRLHRAIDDAGGHLQTGFLGVRHLCPTLSDHGSPERAYDLLLKDTYPSWGFSIRNGATTIWERWDGWTPEKGFQSPRMNSFNHYAYGSVGEWLFGRVAGIESDEIEPGFKLINMAPVFDRRLGWCRAHYDGHLGRIESAWEYVGDEIEWRITVPANSRARVTIPGGYSIIKGHRLEESGEVLLVGSGQHVFKLSVPITDKAAA